MSRKVYRAYLNEQAGTTSQIANLMPTVGGASAAPAAALPTSGTASNDSFTGSDASNVFDGKGGNDTIDGAGGNDVLRGGQGNDQVAGGAGNDVLDGNDGNDTVSGGADNDVASGGSGEDSVLGGDGNDNLSGGAGRDYLDGGTGVDVVGGGSGRDVILGADGDDRLEGGSGGDVVLAGDDNDTAWGATGNDYVAGGYGNDVLFGGTGADVIDGGDDNDLIDGGNGNDSLLDGNGNDIVSGGAGADSLGNSRGNDTLIGGQGNDRLVSWSDAGEPEIAQGGTKVNEGEPLGDSSDVLVGGGGADTFMFHLAVDAKSEIIAKYTDANTGRIDWKGVTGENGNPHDHWLESIGNDVIADFRRSQGDKIVIEGHTVEVASIELVDANNDGKVDYSVISLISQQGASGAHDEDQVGTITVYGDAVTAADISLHAHSAYGVDTFEGKTPVYGTIGDDELTDGRGSQVVFGGAGDDVIIALGDGGEPVPAQDASGLVYKYEPAVGADDVFIGGHGGDTFEFRALINAKQSILDKHRNGDGTIDWQGVTGENGNVHDHWVEGFGNDVIYDFEAGDHDGDGHHGDHIMLEGHTLAYTLEYRDTVSAADTDTEADYTVITLYSDQGGAGAHDQDPLGTITVYGDLVMEDDIHLHAHAYWGIDSLEGAVA